MKIPSVRPSAGAGPPVREVILERLAAIEREHGVRNPLRLRVGQPRVGVRLS